MITLRECALRAIFCTGVLLLVLAVQGQEPPLFQPIVALERHTRDLNDPDLYVADYYPQIPRFHYQYTFDETRPTRPDDESAFQTYPIEYPGPINNHALEKTLWDYLDENIPQQEEATTVVNKRVLSSFRERMEREKTKEQHEKLAETFLQKLQDEAVERDRDDNRDYLDMNALEDLWEQYKDNHQNKNPPMYLEEMKKRQIPVDYSTLGWASVGYKKRGASSDSNGVYFLKYPSQKDILDNTAPQFSVIHPGEPIRSDMFRSYNPEYRYAKRKRFPVAKRSSNFYGVALPPHHKRSNHNSFSKKLVKKESISGTDPKVIKDLSNIFGASNSKEFKEPNSTSKITKPKKPTTEKKITSKKPTSTALITRPPDFENISPTAAPLRISKELALIHNHDHFVDDEPLNIQKKSIDWSNYFGIDRRKKKSETVTNDNDINNQWLINRYNNAVELAVKRTSDYPLKFFRDHDMKRSDREPEESTTSAKEEPLENQQSPVETTTSVDEMKLDNMDDKLKNIEDLIIDEALKYTGSRDGDIKPKEIQEIKDKIISRLAAAYSLEKMRRALSEFKTSLQQQKMDEKNAENDQGKDAKKKKNKECTENCGDGGNEIEPEKSLESSTSQGLGRCSVIGNRCRKMVNNGFRPAFYSICKWHQLCYLCGTETGSPEELSACDVMFLSRTDSLCQSDVVCQWAAQGAVNFLRELHESAPMKLSTGCDSNTCDFSTGAFNMRR